MKPADKDAEMKRFSEGKTDIMVATTVIEVGVNVPNASVMIIESAERFGLSRTSCVDVWVVVQTRVTAF
jgi:ATP-dependent DNA helicase RecG